MTPRLRGLKVLAPRGFIEVAYAEWGTGERTAICVHGLTRNARDFDWLAPALARRGWRVLCPDMPGRGRSAWMSEAKDYGYALYLSVAAALIARADAERISWVGTSMGGILGMMVAAQPHAPLDALVLNDVGAFIPKAAIVRLSTYVGGAPAFADLAAAEAYLRRVHAPFGALTDAQWRHLAVHGTRQAEDGLRLNYDPAIALPFKEQEPQDVDLRPIWQKVACPTLILRGATSDLLLAETAAEMSADGRARLVEFTGCGHAPSLMEAGQIDAVAAFLEPN
jgi:pimeloyl-ACP methyl ester carboxylesterase